MPIVHAVGPFDLSISQVGSLGSRVWDLPGPLRTKNQVPSTLEDVLPCVNQEFAEGPGLYLNRPGESTS